MLATTTYVDDSDRTHIDVLRSEIDKQLAAINKINVEERLEAAEQRMLQLQATLDKQLQASEKRTNRLKDAITTYHYRAEKEVKQLKRDIYEKFKAHKQQARRRIHETIHSLKLEMNRLAPISKLPVELLSLIFIHYIHDPDLRSSEWDLELQLYSGRNIEPDPCSSIKWADIVRVVRVCRIWRKTALQTPDFWTEILVEPMHRMAKMLDRSKQLLLNVRLSRFPSNWWSRNASSRPLLVDNMERVRELHLDMSSTNINRILNIISPSCESSELRSLYLRGDDWFHHTSVEPLNLPLICMPNIQYLDISRHPTYWRLFHKAAKQSGFRMLVSLKLEGSRWPPSVERSGFYDILSTMSNLQILSLINVLPPHTPNQQPLERRASLPCLSSCTILSSTPSECTDFHMNVSYPATTAKLYFQFNVDTRVPDNGAPGPLRTLLDFWGLSKSNHQRAHSNLLLVVKKNLSGFQIKATLWDGPFPKSLQHYDSEQPSVILDFFSPSFELSSRFLELISIRGLRKIGLKFQFPNIPWSENCWRSFFQHQEQVTHLHIRSLFARDVIYGLSSSWVPTASGHYRKQSSDHRSSLYLHSLTKLVLEGHGEPLLAERRNEDNDAAPSAQMEADIAALMDFLQEHCDQHLPLQEMHFTACDGWTVASFSKLSGLVQAVTWSGWVPPYKSVDESDSDGSYVTDSDGADSGDGEENEEIHLTTPREGSDGAALSSNDGTTPAGSGGDNEGSSEDDDSEKWSDDTATESDTDDEFWY